MKLKASSIYSEKKVELIRNQAYRTSFQFTENEREQFNKIMRKKQTIHAVVYRRYKRVYSTGQCHEEKKQKQG